MKQPINPKVKAGAAAGGSAALILWVAGAFGVELPAEAAIAVSTLLSFAAGYIKSA